MPWDKLSEFHKQANRGAGGLYPGAAALLRLAAGERAGAGDRRWTRPKWKSWRRWSIGAGAWSFVRWAGGYAETRDDFLKLHDRLVDWEELPEGTKEL